MKEICTALAKAQGALKKAAKDSTNPHFRSRYADLESVIEAMREPFTENGLSVTQSVEPAGEGLMMETTIWHDSGQQITSTVPLIITKQDMQGVGSAITYARRYGLAAACGITQTDDDGEAAVGRPAAAQKQKPAPASTVPTTLPFHRAQHKGLIAPISQTLNIPIEFLREHSEELLTFLEANATNKDVQKWVESFYTTKKGAQQ